MNKEIDLNIYESNQGKEEDSSNVKIRPIIEKKKSTHSMINMNVIMNRSNIYNCFWRWFGSWWFILIV